MRWRERGVQRTRRFATKREAEKFIGDLARGAQPTDASRITLTEWIAYWLVHHGQAWAPRTVKDRADYAKRLILPHLGHLRLSEITKGDVRQWQRELARSQTPYTVNRVVEVLRAALGAAEKDDVLGTNPARGIGRLPRTRELRQSAEISSVEALRAAMTDPADRLIVSLMAYAGLRPSEARAITWGDIGESAIRVHATKTGTVRFVPILAPVLQDVIAARSPRVAHPHPALETVLVRATDPHNWRHRVWDPARRAAGVSITAYQLRHLYGSLMVQAGHSLIQVAAWMGHSDLAMLSQVYGHVLAEYETSRRGLDVEAEVMNARREAEARHDASRI